MKTRLLIVLTLIGMITVSCSKDYFDEDRYEELITVAFPVSDVDSTHNWNSTVECTANIGVDIAEGKTYTVKVYENNPMSGYMGYVLVQGQVENGNSLVSNFSHPQVENTFYVAVVDESGTTYSQSVTVEKGMLSAKITANSLAAMSGTQNKVHDMGFDMKYCFEDSYPQSGDYDFNDVVIDSKMTKNIGKVQTTITFDLTLEAVGSTKMMAAALHVAGLGAADVESVTCEGDLFNYYMYGLGSAEGKDKKKLFPVELPEEGYLQSALQTGIYIPLTNDVHYAMNNGTTTTGGMVERMNYNTMLPSQMTDVSAGGKNANMLMGRDITPVKGTVTITLKPGVGDKNITVKNIDMFIMEEYNGAIWEVHTFIYKTKPVVFAQGIYEENIYPWAVAVPGSKFRWPAEGIYLGAYKNAGMFGGAYQKLGHSFGEWAKDKNDAKDWYLYPTSNVVY